MNITRAFLAGKSLPSGHRGEVKVGFCPPSAFLDVRAKPAETQCHPNSAFKMVGESRRTPRRYTT
jgi:hypothetical protein